MDALGLPRAVLAGYDRGGRAACVAAVLRPERCTGLVSVNGPRVHHQVPRAGHDLPQEAPAAFDNPDWVEVVLHSYRHRLGAAPGDPRYQEIEDRLAGLPPVTVPAVTLDGLADGNFPATDGSPTAHRFTGPRVHHQVPRAGHNLPQEAPGAFADAVLEAARLGARAGAEPD